MGEHEVCSLFVTGLFVNLSSRKLSESLLTWRLF
jgi:hypothetical protein